jgi:4-hydroxy-2-oxoglutarate aldolase
MYTSVTLSPDAVGLLSRHPNIVGIKESGNDMQLLADYLAASRGEQFVVLCGSATSFFSALALGVHGGVLALSGIVPEKCVELMRLVRDGRISEARQLQETLMPIARAIGAQHGVPALKAALTMLGYETGDPRPPLRPASAAVLVTLRAQLTALGLLEAAPAPI